MTDSKKANVLEREQPLPEDLLDKQYHQIGISAVAAAVRYQHEGDETPEATPAQPDPHKA
jgi:hypothetical protein